MRNARHVTFALGVAAVALLALAPARTGAQTINPNAAPNPYRLEDGWAKLPLGRGWGMAISIGINPDGKSIWVFDRCGARECTNSKIAPLQEFDANGKLMAAIGTGMFVWPHGLFVDADGNLWVTDGRGAKGKGHTVMKLSPEGKVLMTLGRPGVASDGPDTFNSPSAVLVATNGDIFVADGHGETTNARIVKFSKDGKFIKAWGGHGSGPGQFNIPHRLAFDSTGRLFVADRGNSRLQIFDRDGKFLAEWRQFGRPSGLFIDKNDTIYVADSQSDEEINPPFQQGIRIGSAKDGKVTAFIPETVELGALEGVAADAAGNVYAGYTGTQNFRRFVKK
jgi:DNA-binding beta-propeller fold protein YncE